ncbi:MAG: PEGA domain-containing protein [Candidatus Poribacteria bacterium]|nr:PEGA domain-containing protein [Candidatus Poribacteria bacterium]
MQRIVLPAVVAVTTLLLISAFLFSRLKANDVSKTESSAENKTNATSSQSIERTGAIQISCSVLGATIYIDGNPAGQTRDESTIVKGLEIGFHEITLKKSGFSPSPELIVAQVVAEDTTPLKFTLTRGEGSSVSLSQP